MCSSTELVSVPEILDKKWQAYTSKSSPGSGVQELWPIKRRGRSGASCKPHLGRLQDVSIDFFFYHSVSAVPVLFGQHLHSSLPVNFVSCLQVVTCRSKIYTTLSYTSQSPSASITVIGPGGTESTAMSLTKLVSLNLDSHVQ